MADFTQEARDQGCLHIAVKSVGEASRPLLKVVLKGLRQQISPIQLAESKGTVLFLRLVDGDDPPSWDSSGGRGWKWDQFSAHKKILGLLCVALCHHDDDLSKIKAGFKESQKAHPDLYASKCVVYGPKRENSSSDTGLVHIEYTADDMDVVTEDLKLSSLEELVNEFARSIYRKLWSKIENYSKLVEDPSRTDPLPHLKSPLDKKESVDEEEQR